MSLSLFGHQQNLVKFSINNWYIHNVIFIPSLDAIDCSSVKVERSPLYSLVVSVTLNVVANEIVSRLITTDTRPEDS